MTDTGPAPDNAAASPEPQPAAGDTPVESSQTPGTDDLDTAVATVLANADRIPPEKLRGLFPHLQPAITRRLNLFDKSVGTVARKMLEDAEVQLPEGKTVMDLLSEGDGRDFLKLISEAQAQKMKPLLDYTQQQRVNQSIAEYSALAQQEFPLVREFAKEIGPVLANDPDLAELASHGEWRGLPLVMQGVAYKLAYEKAQAELTKAQKLLEASATAAKTGRTTSRAGGPSPAGDTHGKRTLDQALEEAFKRVGQGAA